MQTAHLIGLMLAFLLAIMHTMAGGDAAGTNAAPKAVTPEFHEGTGARHESFNAISKKGVARLVFVGDSITYGWENEGKKVWAERYAKHDAANFGISGDRTENVLWRLDHGNFDGLKPRLIVLMIGTNNTGHRQDKPEDTTAGIGAILGRLRTKCPDSKVLLLAIFPRGAAADDPQRRINDQVNALITKFADGERIRFKDIGATFLDAKGRVRTDVMPDAVHLNEAGYALWGEAIEPEVRWGLGEG